MKNFETYGDFINYFNGEIKKKLDSFKSGNEEDLIEVDYYSSNSWEKFYKEVMKDVKDIEVRLGYSDRGKVRNVKILYKGYHMFSHDLRRSRVKGEKLGYRSYDYSHPIKDIFIDLYKEEKNKFYNKKWEEEYYSSQELEEERKRKTENDYQEKKDKFFEENGITLERFFELEEKFREMYPNSYLRDGLRERWGNPDMKENKKSRRIR